MQTWKSPLNMEGDPVCHNLTTGIKRYSIDHCNWCWYGIKESLWITYYVCWQHVTAELKLYLLTMLFILHAAINVNFEFTNYVNTIILINLVNFCDSNVPRNKFNDLHIFDENLIFKQILLKSCKRWYMIQHK